MAVLNDGLLVVPEQTDKEWLDVAGLAFGLAGAMILETRLPEPDLSDAP